MASTPLPDDTRTAERLQSVVCVIDWLRELSPEFRVRFLQSLALSSESQDLNVIHLVEIANRPDTPPSERQRVIDELAAKLFPESWSEPETLWEAEDESSAPIACAEDSHQAEFARRLQEIMTAKQISQRELATRIGCTQPAISQLLHRERRPRKQTILKLAAALGVSADKLWPQVEVLEMLDTVASFQAPDYSMTPAEAAALRETSQPNRPSIPAHPLPRPRR
jgi:transcriptional regulator with XRE-family HTH domain